jgi:DAACS family dicarboxylate/amino acid:cation (Na+ or H+) symporter
MSTSSHALTGRILKGLVIGVVAGLAVHALATVWPQVLQWSRTLSTQALDPLGQVFLRMLFFVVVPLIFSSLAAGVAQIGRLERLGPLAGRTFLLFFLNMSIAVAIGFTLMNTLQPGMRIEDADKARLMAEYGGTAQKHPATQTAQPSVTPSAIVEMFMPRNLLGAVVGQSTGAIGEVLPLILFAILLGAAATQLAEERRARLIGLLEIMTDLMTGIVHFALRLAPYAVPAMIFSVIIKVGPGIVLTLGVFVVAMMLAMLGHLFGTMSLWLRFLARRSPLEFWRAIKAVLVTAFSTSSSNATLPAALDCAREELKLQPSVAGFVLPLGTTMNMSGTALYEGCVVLFVAQVYGVHLGLVQQVVLLLLSVLSAVAVAGIPGGSLPLIAGLLVSFGVPPEGLGIVIGVDRLLDMTRTMVNVGSDMVTATVVDAQDRRSAKPSPA